MSAYASAAVALNNIGVSLLEHGCYDQAMQTLQDAVSILRFGFKQKNASDLTGAPTEAEVSSKLREAMQRVSNRQHSITRNGAMIRIQVLSSNDLSRAVKIALDGHHSQSEAFAIRIEPLDSDALEAHDAECAICLQNFALAYHCTSHEATSLSRSVHLRDGAIRLIAAAHTVTANGQERATAPVQRDHLMHIEVFVLSFLLKVRPQSRKQHDRLAQLRSLVGSHGHGLLYGSFTQGAAAAA